MSRSLTVYHNTHCSKSRATLELLEKSGATFRIIEYVTSPPTERELETLLGQLGLEPRQIARTHEDRFEELGLDRNPPATREEWIRVLVANPILIERPIVTDGTRTVIGRPPENVLKLL